MSLAALLEAVLWEGKAQGSEFGSQWEGSSGDSGSDNFPGTQFRGGRKREWWLEALFYIF